MYKKFSQSNQSLESKDTKYFVRKSPGGDATDTDTDADADRLHFE